MRDHHAEHLPELRRQFEIILRVARSQGGPVVGNIQLADRLASAVINWLVAVEPNTDD